MDSCTLFNIELNRKQAKNSKSKVVLSWSEGKGQDPTNKLIFPNFSVTNKYPSNFVQAKLKDKILVVVICSIE